MIKVQQVVDRLGQDTPSVFAEVAFDFVYLAAIDISEQKACGFIMGTIAYHSTPWRYRTTAP